MTDISTAVEHLIISGDRVPVAAYQAIYHKLTSKVEKITEIFSHAYEISIDDLIHLNRLLDQAVMQYPVQAKHATCSISLHKNERIDPSSFEKFKMFNFSTNKPTSSISFSFDFFTVLPVEIKQANEIVQRFKVSVVIDQDFVEDEDGVHPFLRSITAGNNINTSIEYSDYNVGRNLQTTIQDWVDSLTTSKVSAAIVFLENKSDFLTTMTPRVFLAASFFGLSRWFLPPATNNVSASILISFCIATLAYILGHVLIVETFRILEHVKPLTFICLTKGDKERRLKMIKRKRRKTILLSFFLGTIVAGILVNLSSSAIYDWLT